MFRLILMFALFVIAVTAVTVMWTAIVKIRTEPSTGDTMPETFKRISYVLLIVLMFGICTGFLGAV